MMDNISGLCVRNCNDMLVLVSDLITIHSYWIRTELCS